MKLGKMKVAQALHGYRDGHKLLASSIPLDEYAAIEMARMSDFMPQSLGGSASYLCGYPLKSMKKYVFSKTWAAQEMSRPGCVWTHSLLLDYPLVAKLATLASLHNFFARPNSGDYSPYSEELDVGAGVPTSVDEGEFYEALDDNCSEVSLLRRALASIYIRRLGKIILPSLSASQNDSVVVLLWNQMAPRLRRDFVFCSAGTTRSLTPSAEVTLIISEEAIADSECAVTEDEDSVINSLLQDVIVPGKTELRSFVSRYVTDAFDARYSVVLLASIAHRLFSADTVRGLSDAASATAHSFPRDGDCGLLKRELLLGSLLDIKRFSEEARVNLVLSTVLPAFKNLSDYSDIDTLDNLVRQVGVVGTEAVRSLIQVCNGVSQGSLGYELLRSVCSHFPIGELAAISLPADSKLMLASLENELIEREQFWQTFENEPSSSDWELLNSIGNLEKLASGFLQGRMYSPVRVWLNENPSLFTPSIIRFLLDKDDAVRDDVLREFRYFRQELVEQIGKFGKDGLAILDSVARDMFYSPYPEVRPESWLRIFREAAYSSDAISPHIAFALFEQAGRISSRDDAIFLYQLSFDVLHALDITSGGSARSVSEKIRNTYPIDYASGQSDTASRVRRKLCDFFQTSKEYASFFKCTQNDETLGQLFLSMSRLWQGNAWLSGLLNAIDDGKVVVTSRQKMFLIQSLPPKKQKGPFSFW